MHLLGVVGRQLFAQSKFSAGANLSDHKFDKNFPKCLEDLKKV